MITHDYLNSLPQHVVAEAHERLLTSIDVAGHPGDFLDPAKPWYWTGCKDKGGYGRISVGGRNVGTHQLSFFVEHGRVPPSVRHVYSGAPHDVNPDRLVAGDAKNRQNMADRRRDGNDPIGERNGRSKLRKVDIPPIRARGNAGESFDDIAKDYPVHRDTIRDVVRRKTWKHVE